MVIVNSLLMCNCTAQVATLFASLEVEVQVDVELLNDPTDDHDKVRIMPIANAFVWVPDPSSIKNINLTPSTRVGLKDWLKHLPQSHPPRKYSFRAENGKLVPENLIINKRDTVEPFIDDRNYIWISLLHNHLPGSISRDWSYSFWYAEPAPLPVDGPSWMKLQPAHILITDQQLATQTNEQGIARFEKVPVGCDIPLRVFSSKVKQDIKTKLLFPTLEKSVNGRPVFFAKEPGHFRHVIQIVKDSDEN